MVADRSQTSLGRLYVLQSKKIATFAKNFRVNDNDYTGTIKRDF